jgi:tetratricopeptide (TPR) repeat protein
MMRKIATTLLMVGLLLLPAANAGASPQEEGKRIALIFGNNAYTISPLQNAVNDARAVDKALRDAGFKTILKENASKSVMEEAVADFVQMLGPDDTALFFYAGHGIQIENENFLVPVDFEAADTVIKAKYKCFSMAQFFDLLKNRSKRSIVILDACRSNPVSQQQALQSGLAQPQNAGKETYIAYSTSPGQVAADNPNGRNSWFTEALSDVLTMPGLTLDDISTRVRARVSTATDAKQIPWSTSNLTSKFYFHPPLNAETENDPTVTEKWLEEAKRREQREEWDAAIELMNRVIQKKAGGSLELAANAKLPYLVARRDGQAAYDKSDFTGAAVQYEAAIKMDPFAIEAAFHGVNSYLLNDKLSEALKLLKSVRLRGTSADIEKANAMLKELGIVYPEASVELKAGIPQPPKIEEVFSGVHFGVPDWDAGSRYLRAQPVELGRPIKELTDAFPPPVVSTSPAPQQAAAEVAPAQSATDQVTNAIFHVEVIPTGASRDIRIRRIGEVKVNNSGVQRPSGVPVKIDTTPPGAELAIEGDPGQHCQSPCVMSLPPTRQTIQATLPGYKQSVKPVTVAANGGDVQIALEAEFGLVQLEGAPGQTPVVYDGKVMSQQVPVRLQLPVGKYEIREMKNGQIVGTQAVEITAAAVSTVTVKR